VRGIADFPGDIFEMNTHRLERFARQTMLTVPDRFVKSRQLSHVLKIVVRGKKLKEVIAVGFVPLPDDYFCGVQFFQDTEVIQPHSQLKITFPPGQRKQVIKVNLLNIFKGVFNIPGGNNIVPDLEVERCVFYDIIKE
jgi:hypothetical protein